MYRRECENARYTFWVRPNRAQATSLPHVSLHVDLGVEIVQK